MTVEELKALLDAGVPPYVLDVREPLEALTLDRNRLARANPQARPDQGAAQRGHEPVVMRGIGHAITSERSHSRPAQTRPAMIVSRDRRAGVASPVSEGSRVSR